MKKTTIFVEGWTELAWVREYLLKWHGYEEAWVECHTLFNEKGMHAAPYPYKPASPLFHYNIINVGGDMPVNNALVRETPRLRNEGFHRIIGLRDMLSDTYRDFVDAHKVDNDVIEKSNPCNGKPLKGYSKTRQKMSTFVTLSWKPKHGF